MPQQISPIRGIGTLTETEPGNARDVTEGDINTGANAVVDQDNDITLFKTQVPAGKVYLWGYGVNGSRDMAEGFYYQDLLAGGAGDGNDGDLVTGTPKLTVLDPEAESVVAEKKLRSSKDLSEAESESRSDQPFIGLQWPYAGEDYYLAYRFRADSNSDGYQVAGDSDIKLPYTEMSVNRFRQIQRALR